MDIDMKEQIKTLVKRAAEAQTSHDAMHFSQAACNAANAVRQLMETEKLA